MHHHFNYLAGALASAASELLASDILPVVPAPLYLFAQEDARLQHSCFARVLLSLAFSLHCSSPDIPVMSLWRRTMHSALPRIQPLPSARFKNPGGEPPASGGWFPPDPLHFWLSRLLGKHTGSLVSGNSCLTVTSSSRKGFMPSRSWHREPWPQAPHCYACLCECTHLLLVPAYMWVCRLRLEWEIFQGCEGAGGGHDHRPQSSAASA